MIKTIYIIKLQFPEIRIFLSVCVCVCLCVCVFVCVSRPSRTTVVTEKDYLGVRPLQVFDEFVALQEFVGPLGRVCGV